MDGEGNLDRGAKAAVGKSNRVVDEHNDWAEFGDGVRARTLSFKSSKEQAP